MAEDIPFQSIARSREMFRDGSRLKSIICRLLLWLPPQCWPIAERIVRRLFPSFPDA